MTRRGLFVRLLAAAGIGTGLASSRLKRGEAFARAVGEPLEPILLRIQGPRIEFGPAVMLNDSPITGELVD